LPIEILEHIAFQLLDHDPTLSNTIIVPLLQTCKRINAILAFRNNSHLYSRLFCSRFDYAASAGGLGPRAHNAPHLAHQLTCYSSALRCIQHGNIYDNHVLTAFSACFVLLIEDDGKNRHHLEAAGLPDFVDQFVRKRLHEDSDFSNGWPQESPINCLALWLLRYTSTEDRVGPTQEDVRELNQHNVVNLISPTSSYDADHNGPTTVSPSSMHDNDWYRLTDRIDPMETSSKLNTRYTYGSATGLWQGRARMHEDFTEQQLFLNALLLMRLREHHCIDPQDPVPTGGANGGFDDGIANAWIPNDVQIYEDRDAKLRFYHRGRVHTYEAYRPGIANSHDEATCKGCLFRGTCDIIYREDDVYYAGVDADQVDAAMEDDDEQFLVAASSQYGLLIDSILDQRGHAMEEETDVEEDVTCDCDEEYWVQRKCNGVLDIALVGETDFKHGQAWNHHRHYGRVREWDGLVAL
ncbi:hypothetical protein K503DRAFT_788123, partial [Rhizopogon vinicolor AM-OR11-026]